MAEKSLEERIAAFERKAQRAQDYVDISNVFALHEYYHFTPSEEMEMLWAKKHKDVTFGQNWGVMVGLDNVLNMYKNQTEEQKQKSLDAKRKWNPSIPNDTKYSMIGEMGFHMLTTPVIEVAEDGETAKGMWYTPGFMTMFNEKTGKYEANWMYEKYAVDFIKEDGLWKIWHFNVYTDFACPYEKSWVTASEEKVGMQAPTGPDEPGGSTVGEARTRPGIGYKEYSTSRMQLPDWPKPPQPYRTFSETFSY